MNKLFSLKSIIFFLLILTSGFTLYSFFSASPHFKNELPYIDEQFDEKFLYVNSCSRLDSIVSTEFKNSHYDTSTTVRFIDQFLRNRFYHSYSELTFHDNWIAAVCGKIFWTHFLFPVIPCDIIKYPMAACSQQGIIFQQQLEQLNIPSSTIQFFPTSEKTSGHYAVSVYYDSSWHYYDSNQEPLIVDSTMPGIDAIIDKKLYEKMYVRKSNIRFRQFFKTKSYKRVLKEPFSKGRMYYFQTITAFLSQWLWLFLLLTYCLLSFRRSRAK
jgi:hypothetical protein